MAQTTIILIEIIHGTPFNEHVKTRNTIMNKLELELGKSLLDRLQMKVSFKVPEQNQEVLNSSKTGLNNVGAQKILKMGDRI